MPDALKTIARDRAPKDALSHLATERGAGKTTCPSEVARASAADQSWRPLLGPVRAIAVELARSGKIIITRKGGPIDPGRLKDVYRISLPVTVSRSEGDDGA